MTEYKKAIIQLLHWRHFFWKFSKLGITFD